jgi:uncharacterized protein (TIGR02246 family)
MNKQTPTVRDAVVDANKEWADAVRRGDAAGLATLYAEDGQLLAPSGEFLRGRREVQAYWQSRLDADVRDAELEMLDVDDYGDLVLERTHYTMRDEEGRVVDTGKYVLLWERVNGHLALYRDVLTSSPDAPESEERMA